MARSGGRTSVPTVRRSRPGVGRSCLAERDAHPGPSVGPRRPSHDQHGSREPCGDRSCLRLGAGLAGGFRCPGFQMRAIPKSALKGKVRDLSEAEIAELELATDEALGRVEPGRPASSISRNHALHGDRPARRLRDRLGRAASCRPGAACRSWGSAPDRSPRGRCRSRSGVAGTVSRVWSPIPPRSRRARLERGRPQDVLAAA